MKNDARWLAVVLVVGSLLVFGVGCGEEEEAGTAQEVNEDVQHARGLWTQIEGYAEWTQPEDFQGWQEGQSPHGAILKYYVNGTAEQSLTDDGAVIVKENYSEQSAGALKSVTVMQKRAGYDPETENWFYVKYSPEGEVMENPKGMKLAGLVGKDGTEGCVPCHETAGGGDYLFMND
jgi:hypothetical protein